MRCPIVKTMDKGRDSLTPGSTLQTTFHPDDATDNSVGFRERSRTWSNGDRRPPISRPNPHSSKSVLDGSDKLLSQSYHAGQLIQFSVTMVSDENKPSRHQRVSTARISSPRHSIQAAGNHSGLLTPRMSVQDGRSGFRHRSCSKASVMSNDDSSSVSSSCNIGAPRSAWDQFSEHIREIDDGFVHFNPNQRNFKRSDTFSQCCSMLDYKVPGNSDRKESLDVESVYDLAFSREPRLSVFSTRSAGRGRLDSVCQPGVENDDAKSRCSSPSHGLSVCGERDRELSGGSEEDGENELSDEVEETTHTPSKAARGLWRRASKVRKNNQLELCAVADLVQEREPEARQELYKRYLYKPDTWTVGLQKYLKKSIMREKTNKLNNRHNQYPVPVYRPKSVLLGGDKKQNGASTSKRRAVSAIYPATSTTRHNARAPSAMSTMSRYRVPSSLA